MRGLDPRIQLFFERRWISESRPAMTTEVIEDKRGML
jgi:hypothetical protein